MNVFLKSVEGTVSLRPIEESDAPLCAQWLNNPELRPRIRSWLPMSPESEKHWIQRHNEQSTPRSDIVLIIMDDQQAIGTVGLHGIQWDWRFATIGIFVADCQVRHKGIGSQSYRLLLDYAFLEMGLLTIEAEVYATNEPSQKFHEQRMRFKEIGHSDPKALIQGKLVPVITYSMTADRWEQTKNQVR